MQEFNIRLSLGGLGVFIYGMYMFEKALSDLSTGTFRALIQKSTSGRISSILIGTLATVAVQNSGIISLIAVSFAGAGIINLLGAVGLIVGANIGTTIQGIWLSWLGFSYNIQDFALPLLALGGIATVLSPHKGIHMIGKCLMGLGFLFLGLDFMKDNMDALGTYFNLKQYISLGPVFYFFLGIVLTVLIQTSSGLTALTLAALYSGFITFPLGVALVIGANIGTTSTAIIASLGGRVIKRQVARSHVFFNILSSAIGALFFWQFIRFINDIIGLKSNPVMGLAVFNVIFNIVTALVFFPFMYRFVARTQRLFPEEKSSMILAIDDQEKEFTEASLTALRQDTLMLIKKVFKHNLHILNIDQQKLLDQRTGVKSLVGKTYIAREEKLIEEYHHIKEISEKLIAYLLACPPVEDSSTIKECNMINNALVQILYSAKSLKDIRHNIIAMEDSANSFIKQRYQEFRTLTVALYKKISAIIDIKHKNTDEDIKTIHELIKEIQAQETLFVQTTSHELSTQGLQEFELSGLLAINHALYISSKSLVYATKDLLLTDQQQKFFDTL